MGITITVETTKGLEAFLLGKNSLIVGKSATSDIVINDPSVSKEHAIIEREGDSIFITDLNSSTGTFRNGQKITLRSIISFTDNIVIGSVPLHFSETECAADSTTRISRDEMSALRKAGILAPSTPVPPIPPAFPLQNGRPVPPNLPEARALHHSGPPILTPPEPPTPPAYRSSSHIQPIEEDTQLISDGTDMPLSSPPSPPLQEDPPPPIKTVASALNSSDMAVPRAPKPPAPPVPLMPPAYNPSNHIPPANQHSDTGSSNNSLFYLARREKKLGPFTWVELYRLGQEGNLSKGDMLWSEPLAAWTPVERMDALREFVLPLKKPRSKWLFALLLIPLFLACGIALFLTLLPNNPYTVTHVASYPVLPSSKEQVFSYSDGVKVTLPPEFTSKDQTLSVGLIGDNTLNMVDGAVPLMLVDLTLDGGEQPPKPVDLTLSYKVEDLSPDYTPEEQLAAYRWDEHNGWVSLPMRIDNENHTVSIFVDHFTIIGAVLFTAKAVAVGVAATTVAQETINSIYYTPQRNFRILYVRSMLENSIHFDDDRWTGSCPIPGYYFKPDPRFVQEMGFFLENALKEYTALDFRNPAGMKTGWFGNYQQTITVKLDSIWAEGMEDPSYEKIFQYLHIPTQHTITPNQAKVTLAHELFHAVQAQYYGRSGMLFPSNSWWLEATAEYASFVAAWPTPMRGVNEGCGSNYLTFSLDSTGKKSTGWGWNREYEYVTSVWVNYLIKSGVDFKELVESVAKAGILESPTRALDSYLTVQGSSLFHRYQKFAGWMLFSSNSPIKSAPLATFRGDTAADIAINRSTLTQGEGKKEVYTFELPGAYSSKMWTIQLKANPTAKVTAKMPIVVKVEEITPEMEVDIFIVPQGERYLDPPVPAESFRAVDQSVRLIAEVGDLLCVSAVSGRFTDSIAEIVVSDATVLLEIDPPKLPDVELDTPYTFTFTAKNIPEDVKTVEFAWDFKDGSKTSAGSKKTSTDSEGEAEVTINHTYKEIREMGIGPLKVVLRGKEDLSLAEAEASTVIPVTLADGPWEISMYEAKQLIGMFEDGELDLAASIGMLKGLGMSEQEIAESEGIAELKERDKAIEKKREKKLVKAYKELDKEYVDSLNSGFVHAPSAKYERYKKEDEDSVDLGFLHQFHPVMKNGLYTFYFGGEEDEVRFLLDLKSNTYFEAKVFYKSKAFVMIDFMKGTLKE